MERPLEEKSDYATSTRDALSAFLQILFAGGFAILSVVAARRLQVGPPLRLERAADWPLIIVSVLIAGTILLLAGLVLYGLANATQLTAAQNAAIRDFRTAFRGQVFLIATRRRGWRSFLLNNVTPALPAGVQVVWPPFAEPAGLRPAIAHSYSRTPKPFLVRIGAEVDDVLCLNAALLPLRAHQRATREAREAVAAALARLSQTSPGWW